VLVWKLRLSLRSKVSIVVLLGLGSIASIATIARFPYINLLTAKDFLWSNADIAIWSIVELGMCTVATSASTLRPLLIKIHFFPAAPHFSRKDSFNFELNPTDLDGGSAGIDEEQEIRGRSSIQKPVECTTVVVNEPRAKMRSETLE